MAGQTADPHASGRQEGDPGPDPAGEQVGSVADEAAKLFGVFTGWAKEQGEGLSSAAEGVAEGLHEHAATGGPECTWCPVCRVVAAVRQTSPEVRGHLTSAAASLMLAVSGMMATHPPSHDGGVERIHLDADLDRDDEWPEGDT
jgi:hypothetical protein